MKSKASSRLLVEEIPHIEEPAHVFKRFAGDNMPFLFESALQMDKYGRYSIMGSNPGMVIRSKNGITEVVDDGLTTIRLDDPLRVVEEAIEKFGALSTGDAAGVCDIPFTGGAVGYFGYDLNRRIERIPDIAVDDQGIPDIYLGFYDSAIVVDHKERRSYAVCCYCDTIRSDKAAIAGLRRIIDKAFRGVPDHHEAEAEPQVDTARAMRATGFECRRGDAHVNHRDISCATSNLSSNFTEGGYKQAIIRAQEYISAGDIFQVNLSQRFTFDMNSGHRSDHYSLYLKLRETNPAPFAAFLSYGDFSIISSSPERFMYVDDCNRNRYVETRPIKGTRPRFAEQSRDLASIKELVDSEKDAAEHVMIVDVKRNDLGKVCEKGSVVVPELMVVESYRAVHHLVSTVSGKLREDAGVIDLIRASFPGGSITGAPKIRAMEIIEELEPHRRNIYCGSIGYISTNGTMDSNIAIRTITTIKDKGYMQVGGGIVADSDPDEEYGETLHKGRAIFEALNFRMAK